MGIRLEVAAVGVAALVVGAGVGAWQQQQDKVYGATASMQVIPAPATVASTGTRPDNMVFLAHRYAAEITARPVLAQAVAQSGLSITVSQAQRRTSISVSPTDATLHVDATGPSRADARALDLALTQVATQQVSQSQQALRASQLAPLDAQVANLRTQISQDRRGYAEWLADQQQYRTLLAERVQAQSAPGDQLQVLSPTLARSAPIGPHPARSALLGFIVAAAVLGQVVLWRRMRIHRNSAAPAADPYTTETPRTFTRIEVPAPTASAEQSPADMAPPAIGTALRRPPARRTSRSRAAATAAGDASTAG